MGNFTSRMLHSLNFYRVDAEEENCEIYIYIHTQIRGEQMINHTLVKANEKSSLCLTKHHTMKTYWESGGISTQFLTRTLDWGEWSALRPGRFTPRESPWHLLDRRLGGSQNRSRKYLLLLALELSFVSGLQISDFLTGIANSKVPYLFIRHISRTVCVTKMF